MDILISFCNFLIESIANLFNSIINLLPKSPFLDISLAPIQEYLGYMNWIIPVGAIKKIVTLWLGAIAVYYIYSIVLRWVKAIE